MASRGINKAIIVGNLGEDPEIIELKNGDDGILAKLSVATGESWRDKATGEQREKTEWHRVNIFGPLAEIAEQYLSKGSQVYIEGKLQTRSWNAEDGSPRYSTEIIVDGFNGKMQMLGGGQGQQQQPEQQRQPQQPSQQRQPRQPQQRQPQQPQQQYNEPPMDFDDDIPFAPIGLQYPALLNAI